MKRNSRSIDKPAQTLRSLALQFPAAEEGIACAGTASEKRTIKVRGKAFLFLGANDLMLKVRDSLPEATDAASRAAGEVVVGIRGWITVKNLDLIPLAQLVRWLHESYRLFAPKKLIPPE